MLLARLPRAVLAATPLLAHAHSSSSKAAAPQPATLRVGAHACVTHTVKESAQCLGGVRLLFPLLTRLPHAQPPRGEGAPEDRTGEELLVGLTRTLTLTLTST